MTSLPSSKSLSCFSEKLPEEQHKDNIETLSDFTNRILSVLDGIGFSSKRVELVIKNSKL